MQKYTKLSQSALTAEGFEDKLFIVVVIRLLFHLFFCFNLLRGYYVTLKIIHYC